MASFSVGPKEAPSVNLEKDSPKQLVINSKLFTREKWFSFMFKIPISANTPIKDGAGLVKSGILSSELLGEIALDVAKYLYVLHGSSLCFAATTETKYLDIYFDLSVAFRSLDPICEMNPLNLDLERAWFKNVFGSLDDWENIYDNFTVSPKRNIIHFRDEATREYILYNKGKPSFNLRLINYPTI